MSQQGAIVIVVDIPAALKARSLKGNLYMIDNLRADGSEGEGTGELITQVRGSYWSNGSQASNSVLNWMTAGVGSLPSTLPRSYADKRADNIRDEFITKLKDHCLDRGGSEPDTLENIFRHLDTSDTIKEGEHIISLKRQTLDIYGQPFNADKQDISELSFLQPQISAITGEAVEKNVLFPAQYGSPVLVKNGWYWSATVDTNQTGVYTYTLHITLYEHDGHTWNPVFLSHDARIKVSNDPQRNGFTGAGIGFLPIR